MLSWYKLRCLLTSMISLHLNLFRSNIGAKMYKQLVLKNISVGDWPVLQYSEQHQEHNEICRFLNAELCSASVNCVSYLRQPIRFFLSNIFVTANQKKLHYHKQNKISQTSKYFKWNNSTCSLISCTNAFPQNLSSVF